MEQSEFPMPSPKRQRTNSPEEASTDKTADTVKTSDEPMSQETLAADESNDILDSLMQHVESESAPQFLQTKADQIPKPTSPETSNEPQVIQPATNATKDHPLHGGQMSNSTEKYVSATNAQEKTEDIAPSTKYQTSNQTLDATSHTAPAGTEAVAQIDGIPPTAQEVSVNGAQEAEWEIDSSPYESSSEESDSADDTSSDDSDDDEDADGDYAMLDPEEQARILMQGDAGSDDEGAAGRGRTEGTGYKTQNEQLEDVPLIPEITVTSDMRIEELGLIEAVVENNVLIRAKVSGEYQVLESGSLLCFEDRQVAGVIAETLGRVEQPLYTMRFKTGQDIDDRGLQKGKALFYVIPHSSYVFTQPLKAVKGSDASNIHDEEVGDDEMEFSDDEAEAEHKRLMKLKRQGRLGEAGRSRGSGRGRGGRGGRRDANVPQNESHGAAYGNGSLEMNYDDVEEGEEGYTPLSRPSNLHEMMTSNQIMSGTANPMSPPSFVDRGHHGRGRGRGGRDRGRGHNPHRGRGGFQHQQQQQRQQQQQSHQQAPFAGAYQNMGFPLPFPPPPPLLAPQNQQYPGSLAPSPISPLPQQQYQFGSSGSSYQTPPQFQGNQQTPLHNQMFNPAGIQHFASNNQANNGYNGSWQTNQAAVVEVQRQLEEMRKIASQGGNYPPQH